MSRRLERIWRSWLAAVVSATLAVSGCGGGGGSTASADTALPADSVESRDAVTLSIDSYMPSRADVVVTPGVRLARAFPAPPGKVDAVDNMASSRMPPTSQPLSRAAAALDTRGMTVQGLRDALRASALAAPREVADGESAGEATPLSEFGSVTVYTPAQIRAAYDMPVLPAVGSTPTALQAAQLGAGQTIFIIAGGHAPNVAAELAEFNDLFGLPTCTNRILTPSATLPLAAASIAAGCDLTVVYATAGGAIAATAPALATTWALEVALDVQWAHVVAPLARLVLIESATPGLPAMEAAIGLANDLAGSAGGVVSMSFASLETLVPTWRPMYSAPGMTYVAGTGDWATQSNYPAVVPEVLAVGGTELDYTGSGTRREAAWTDSGGAVSSFVTRPSYQTNAVPGLGTPAFRATSDVSFNADPDTGFLIVTIAPGASGINVASVGGTSAGTPIWAGLIASANALRLRVGKPPLGSVHARLYQNVATVPGHYAGAFADVTLASNGACASCTARVGHDAPTGLGTPNVTALLAMMSGPLFDTSHVVADRAIAGRLRTPLAFTVESTAVNAGTPVLSGAPVGMTVSSAGVVDWPNPVLGVHRVTVTVPDRSTSLSAQGLYTITVADSPLPPVVTVATVRAQPGIRLSYGVSVTGAVPTDFTLTNAPAGMTISRTGLINWTSPAAGTYVVTVNANNTSSGLSGSGAITVIVAAPRPPVITVNPLTATAGQAVQAPITVATPDGGGLMLSMTGIPPGVTFKVVGQVVTLYWARPVTGRYVMTLTARDALGQTTQGSMPIIVNRI